MKKTVSPIAGKDITEKILEAYNDVFADIVNVLLFDDREVRRLCVKFWTELRIKVLRRARIFLLSWYRVFLRKIGWRMRNVFLKTQSTGIN